MTEVTKDESEILIISGLAASSFLICLVCTIYHRRKRRKHHHRQLGLHRSGGHYDSTTSATGNKTASCASHCVHINGEKNETFKYNVSIILKVWARVDGICKAAIVYRVVCIMASTVTTIFFQYHNLHYLQQVFHHI